jgi:O-antigen/teichoic acid export membrane protein
MPDVLKERVAVVKGTFWGLTGSMFLKVISFIYTILIARMFTQEDIGTFGLALSIIYLTSIFSDLGLNSAFGRYIPYYLGKGQKQNINILLKTSYIWSGTLSILLSFLLFFSASIITGFYNIPALLSTMQFMAFFLLVNTFFSLNTQFLTGLKKIKQVAFIQNVQNLIKLIITVVLFFLLGAKAYVLAAAFTVSYFFTAVLSFWYVFSELKRLTMIDVKATLHEQLSILKELVPFGLMLATASGLWSILSYVDKIMIGALLPNAASSIGVYFIAVSLGGLVLLFPISLLSIFLPVVSEMYGGNKRNEMLQISTSALRWTIFLAVPITLTLLAFPEYLLQMFFGAAYSQGALVLIIFSLGLFVRVLSYVHGTLLASMRIVKVELFAVALATMVNIVMNWFLIPIYGIEGAAIASTISFFVVTGMLIYYSKKLAGFGFSLEFLKPIFAAVLALIILLLLKQPILYLVSSIPQLPFELDGIAEIILQKSIKLLALGTIFLFACCLYILFLLILRCFKTEDYDITGSALRRLNLPENTIFNIQKLMGKEKL